LPRQSSRSTVFNLRLAFACGCCYVIRRRASNS
jgi:hypothetical protein